MSSSNTGDVGSPMPSDMREDEAPCHILKLSPELRNIIYHETLVHKGVLKSDPRDEDRDFARLATEKFDWELHKLYEPALLRTCKQIRAEALPIFYGGNIFRASSKDLFLFTFINRLTPAKRLMLRNVQICAHYRCSCISRTRKYVEKRLEELPERGIHVPGSAIYIPAEVNCREYEP